MKHRLFFWGLIAALALLPCRQVTSASLAAAVGGQAIIGQPINYCPTIPVKISALSVTPATPAQQHVVNAVWTATPPSCFSITGYEVKGVVTFGNGQTRAFAQSVAATQSGAHIPVAGFPQIKPAKVEFSVQAKASASIAGQSQLPGLTLTSPNVCSTALNVTQAAMIGLVPIPQRPGQDFHPKVRVQWQSSPATCQQIDNYRVEGELVAQGKTHKFGANVPAPQTSLEQVITTVAVGAGFTPDSVSAKVIATGTARITGAAKSEATIN